MYTFTLQIPLPFHTKYPPDIPADKHTIKAT